MSVSRFYRFNAAVFLLLLVWNSRSARNDKNVKDPEQRIRKSAARMRRKKIAAAVVVVVVKAHVPYIFIFRDQKQRAPLFSNRLLWLLPLRRTVIYEAPSDGWCQNCLTGRPQHRRKRRHQADVQVAADIERDDCGSQRRQDRERWRWTVCNFTIGTHFGNRVQFMKILTKYPRTTQQEFCVRHATCEISSFSAAICRSGYEKFVIPVLLHCLLKNSGDFFRFWKQSLIFMNR